MVTAWRGGLYELTPLGRLLADGLLGVAVLGLVALVSSYYGANADGRAIHARAVHWLVTLLAVAGIVIAGYWLVPYTRLLWVDFNLVAAALLLHDPAERVFHRLRQALPRLFLHPRKPEGRH